MPASFLHGVEVVEIPVNGGAIVTASTSVIGLVGTAQYADPAIFPLDTPVLMTSGTGPLAKALTATAPANPAPGAIGTLPQAIADIYAQTKTPVVVVRVEQDTTTAAAGLAAAQLALVNGDQASGTGVWALPAAKSRLGVKPKILIAPGFTGLIPAAATLPPAAEALISIAERLRAVVVGDGLNDTTTAATALAPLVGNRRLYQVDPWPLVLSSAGVVASPVSAMVAGAIARSDQERGYWFSPSNQTLNGVVGTSRPVEFGLSDPSAESNVLNAVGVATIVNSGGFRLWGNRTGSPDQAWSFLSVRRTFDVIEDAVEASYLWAVDRPFSRGLLRAVEGELNAFLRQLKAQGAIIDGRCWLDPDLNTAATIEEGKFYVDFDAEPPAPLERLTFQAARNGGYYTELLASVSGVRIPA